MNSSTGLPSDHLKFDSLQEKEESELSNIRKNIMSLKVNRFNHANKSDIMNINNNLLRKQIFTVSNTQSNLNNNQQNNTNNISNNGNNSGSINICSNNINNQIINNNKNVKVQNLNNYNNKLNHSCNNISFSSSFSKRRGRKKFLLDGFKTEILDKAFLREFRLYLKKSKNLRIIYDELRNDEKLFWNEFLQNNNPPFTFNINNQKVEFKSFNKNLLKYIFSFNSSKNLYSIFIKERGKDIIQSILNKKVKQMDTKMILLYNFYGKNLHKLYSDDYNINDLLYEELENQSYLNIQNSINSICLGDSIINNNVNTSI